MRQSIPQSVKELHPWLLVLRSFRFCLSLLVLAFSFWTVGKLVTLNILHRSYQTPSYFMADIQPENPARIRISSIKVKIYEASGLSVAEIISDDPNIQERELQFTLTSPQDLEKAIAQQLELPLPEVKSLIYYKVLNR